MCLHCYNVSQILLHTLKTQQLEQISQNIICGRSTDRSIERKLVNEALDSSTMFWHRRRGNLKAQGSLVF